MKTTKVKDIPIGILLIVISLYCALGVSYLTNIASVTIIFLIMLLSMLCMKLIIVGIDLLIGIEIKDTK